jgi:hypothetical protein
MYHSPNFKKAIMTARRGFIKKLCTTLLVPNLAYLVAAKRKDLMLWV